MARAVLKPSNDVYVGMIATMCVAMLVGIACAGLELMEYDSSKPPASGLPAADKLRGDMKPLDDNGGVIKYGLAPQPADAPAVAAAPADATPPAVTTPPAMLPTLPVAANSATPAPAGPTPSPLNAQPPSIPATAPPASGPTPSPLNVPPPQAPRI